MAEPKVPAKSARYLTHVNYTIIREPTPVSGDELNSPESVAATAGSLIPDDGREHFYVLLLDQQNRLTATHNVSIGSLSAAIVHPREVLGPAIREGAAHIILLHNHPSGDPTPSKEDIQLTRQLLDGAKLLGITVHDHVVIGSGTNHFVSLSQRGLL